MINLIYGSSALRPMTTPELVEILAKAREKNHRLGITGMLLYKSGNFLQVLEGEEQPVLDLYEVIRQDSRHHQVEIIAVRSVKERHFGEWEMGFLNLDTDQLIDLPGYSHFLKEPLDSARLKDGSFAHTFLHVFKEAMR